MSAPMCDARSRENLHARVERLWTAALAGDEYAATEVVLEAVAAGVDDETVLLDLVAAVQRRLGREWAANTIDVAQEHTATAVNERVIGALRRAAAHTRADRGRITVACVEGEWHALPARLVAEVLTRRSFRVDYLGAQVPAPHLVEHVHRTGPDVVAVSASVATCLPTAHATITACAATGTPVIAGGAAFGPEGRYARLLGAQAWAPDARAAADLLAAGPLPAPNPRPEPVEDLPYAIDQEYTLLCSARPNLVRTLYTRLDERIPAMRHYTPLQRQYAAEDLQHVVEFLAAALYVDDVDLFAGFLAWTADILAARAVPPRALLPTLDLLGAELRDLPRATRLLAEAGSRLSEHLRASHPGDAP